MHYYTLVTLFLLLALCPATSSNSAQAQTGTAEATFNNVANRLTDHTYKLVYKLTPGDKLRYEVLHEAIVDASVQGKEQKSHSRSKSGKTWEINQIDPQGNTVLTHAIDYIDMWSRTGEHDPISYDSRDGKEPPIEYINMSEMIQKPLSVITISPSGKIVDRKDNVPQFDMGTGGLTVPLPTTPVKVGTTWTTPGVVRVKNSDGIQRAIKTSQLYKLEKVETGIATISLKTEVISLVDDPRIESQLVQRLTNGEIKFDLDAGVIRSRTLDWDENVIGFNGPESRMKYTARLTETLDAAKVARK